MVSSSRDSTRSGGQKMMARPRAHSDSTDAGRSVAKTTGVGRRGSAHRSGRLVALAIYIALVFSGSANSPASALLRPGTTLQGGSLVDPCLPEPQVTITATPQNITKGQTTSLQWSVQVPTGCAYSVVVAGQSVDLEGTMPVTPLVNHTVYEARVYWGPALATSPLEFVPSSFATVSIGVLPAVVEISGNTDEWKALLVQALDTP